MILSIWGLYISTQVTSIEIILLYTDIQTENPEHIILNTSHVCLKLATDKVHT